MAIKLPCPRCKRPLSVPNKKAGGYVQCPQCNGRLWVPKDAPADATHLDDVVAHGSPPPAAVENAAAAASSSARAKTSVPLPPPASSDTLAKVLAPAAAPVAVPPNPAVAPSTAAPPPPFAAPPRPSGAPQAEPGRIGSPQSEPGLAGPETSGRHAPAPSMPQSGRPATAPGVAQAPWGGSPAAATPAAPPVASRPVVPPGAAGVAPVPPPGRKVAHFISAEAAQSTLKLADGKLPELHLDEGEQKEKSDAKPRSVNPVVLVVALAVSVVMSIVLAVSDWGPGADGHSESKSEARRVIREKYYSDLDKAATIKPYQQLLRDADLAHVRRDYGEERRLYRAVLDLLHAEGRAPGEGVTGSPDRDRDLEKHISILLSKD